MSPGIREKVAFLRRPEVYPAAAHVDVIKTHMSWVFLTEAHVWKLKRPVCSAFFDFRSLESRRINSEQEVRLNRRLAPDVYLGVVPLTVENGALVLGGDGDPVDWLVKMRRLPAGRMLNQVIADRTWRQEDLRKVGAILGRFYRTATVIEISGAEYRKRLMQNHSQTLVELEDERYGLPPAVLRRVGAEALKFIEQQPELFDARAKDGRIVDAHGDLRPEHICLEPNPVVIDCLEFNRSLRILDAASEMSFLRMECERLGSLQAGSIILQAYLAEARDNPPEQLLRFYRNFHACVRAKLALWHLTDPEGADSRKWIARARAYLDLATRQA
jgi:aminoglycoside phosphotransferase family enzyme